MKKTIYFSVFLAFLFLTVNTFAQSDTLLYEDFQGDVEPYMLIFPDDYAANDTTWINWDAEQETDANNRHGVDVAAMSATKRKTKKYGFQFRREITRTNTKR